MISTRLRPLPLLRSIPHLNQFPPAQHGPRCRYAVYAIGGETFRFGPVSLPESRNLIVGSSFTRWWSISFSKRNSEPASFSGQG
jgi:hypothetical protein